MDRFIEVVGSAMFVENVVEYRADVTFQVRAAQVETAIKEVSDLRADCIRRLKEAGLSSDELSEGGSEVWRPWFWKKRPGQEASQKLLVACKDMNRLMSALGALEPLFENPRFSLSVSMRTPCFQTSEFARREAEKAAIANAEAKAENVARNSGLKLDGVLEIEELDAKTARSGAYGDQEWMGFAAAASASAGEADEPLEAAARYSTIRFRVRYVAAQDA